MRRGRELITGGVRAPRVVCRDNSTPCAVLNASSLPPVYQCTTCLHSAPYNERRRPSSTRKATTRGIRSDRPTSTCRRWASTNANSATTPHQQHRLTKETQSWLDEIVIGQKLCPFAPPVRSPPQLRTVASDAATAEQLVEQISAEADLLVAGLLSKNADEITVSDNDGGMEMSNNKNNNSSPPQTFPETTLVILDTQIYPSLSEYRNLIQLSWRIQSECIVDRGHSDRLQLVLFHPLAVHDTYTEQPEAEREGDCANYTLRSPHPTVHLLRQVDVMRAARGGYADLEGLPTRNKAKLRRDGLEVCRRRLEGCSSF
mmetsp:Transcript_33850/g.99764  ORF Transcript_33850/g.99764 Transcript_33850/m.99764 type:complete len:316 (+) Transcript_33850:141-1088(+)